MLLYRMKIAWENVGEPTQKHLLNSCIQYGPTFTERQLAKTRSVQEAHLIMHAVVHILKGKDFKELEVNFQKIADTEF